MSIWIVPYAIGAAQAVLLAAALWRREANRRANRVLSVWLGLTAFDLAVRAANFSTGGAPWLWLPVRVVSLFPFLHASLFYLYVRTLVGGRAVSWRDAWHLAGFALSLAWFGVLWRSLGARATPAFFASPWFDPALFAYALAYLAAALRLIHRYRRDLRQRRADADRWSLRWLVLLVGGQLAIWAVAVLHAWLRLPWLEHATIYGAVAAWICAVGYFSLAQPPVAPVPAAEPEAAGAEAAAPSPPGDPRVPEVRARLARLMAEQQLYREPALTVAQLARRSGYPEYLVSAVINRCLGGNFWEYINRLRIEAVCAHLADAADRRPVLDIAYACGFTSKSTFNGAFKRLLGETPSAYRRRHAAQASGGG
ncbi:AraC family transcriptional regulator [Luteimonas sp. Y-2-2-4F]|nr:AraC family transcriptional regulator [Luteimonas sp. Y-2-2-4F]MCD9033697.1 AraC family transcriptional regulator [Luteimonas sp. Y-2-2-4F]